MHSRGCFNVELLSLTIWLLLSSRRSVEHTVFRGSSAVCWGGSFWEGDARAGSGSIITATEKACQYLLAGQTHECMECIGRVQGNLFIFMFSNSISVQRNGVSFVGGCFVVVFAGFLSKGKNDAKFQTSGLSY